MEVMKFIISGKNIAVTEGLKTAVINSAMPLASGIKVLPRPWIAERYTYSRYSTHKKTAMINKYLYAISNTCRV